MVKYIIHDHNDDGIDRRGFLRCMTWAGTGVIWAISGGIPKSFGFAQIAKGGSRCSQRRPFLRPNKRQPYGVQ